MYVATSRMMQNNYAQPYGSERSNKVHYNRIDVGIPQQHVKGLVEINAYKPTHDKYFAAVSLQKYDNKEQFKQQLNAALAKKAKRKREIFLLSMDIIIILQMAHFVQHSLHTIIL